MSAVLPRSVVNRWYYMKQNCEGRIVP